MKINCLGGGPASLYFAILMKKSFPDAAITIYEQNKFDDTFGFGVVFSDATMDGFKDADEPTWKAITDSFEHWDDIDIHVKGQVLSSTGHGFAGMSRKEMLIILQNRARELGVEMLFETLVENPDTLRDCDLLFAADGVNSVTRERYQAHFRPEVDFRPNRFVWLGSDFNFPAFTFHFIENEHGLWRTHCYRYMQDRSTVIVECTEETFARTGLAIDDEAANVAYVGKLLDGFIGDAKLINNRSHWRQFPNIACGSWVHENVVLAGDAVHTAHFSIGSGTKLAMENAIALHGAIVGAGSIGAGLPRYEEELKPAVESLQRAARVSQQWFEDSERYHRRLEPIQFGFSLLTRSLRISHENLKVRDPDYVAGIDTWFARAANAPGNPAPPPMFTPFKLREMVVPNRVVVSPMCQYSAAHGTIDDWHLVHLGSRALGGAGLVITEMTDVSADGRISPGCAGMYDQTHLGAWKRVVDFVHAHSHAKIGMQLAHAGRKGSTRIGWEGYDMPLEHGNWPLLAASSLPYIPGTSTAPKAMDRADMDRVRDDFARAAGMAEEAGFDLIELHFAHGYLLNTFLSPLTNRRGDEYGGSLENRLRYPLEVFAAVRAAWPDEKPISVRVSAHDWRQGGFMPEDAVPVGAALKARGCDIVDVSSGQVVADEEPVYGRLFQTPFADRVRLEAEIPTMTVGNISSYEDVNSILAAGRADLCVLARAHLYDPYWTRHAATELGYDMPWPDPYHTIDGYIPRFKASET